VDEVTDPARPFFLTGQPGLRKEFEQQWDQVLPRSG